MKKVVFSLLAVVALVLTFANHQAQQQASVTDPISNGMTPLSVTDPISN